MYKVFNLFILIIFLVLVTCIPVIAGNVSKLEVEKILELYSDIDIVSRNIAKSTCLPAEKKLTSSYIREFNRDINNFNKGNLGAVLGSSYNNAEIFAYCCSQSKSPCPTNIAAEVVGNFIGLNVIALHSSGGGIEKRRITHAITLLRYANQNGLDKSFILNKLESISPQNDEKINMDDKNIIKVTAFELVKQRDQNELRFKKKYKGKMLEVTGKIVKISEYRGDIRMSLLGTNKDIDDKGLRDDIDCIIAEGSESFDRAIDLNKGEIVTVVGFFKDFNFLSRVELRSSSIISKK